MRAEEIFRELQKLARAEGRLSGKPSPTGAYLIRHGLESFLARLAQTDHAEDFILKGGILIGVYGVRRPTKDVDAEAVSRASQQRTSSRSSVTSLQSRPMTGSTSIWLR